jgi:hypothetical protein
MEASNETSNIVDIRNIKRQGRVYTEIPVTYLSKDEAKAWAWFNTQTVDPIGDPLAILIGAEEEDEVACALMRGEGIHLSPLPRAA